jgi:flagellar M-ring protein FliF
MKPVLDMLRPLLERWKALPMGRRFLVIAAAALLVAGSLFAWARATAPNYAVLFSNLESGDAGAIVEQLKAAKTPYKLERGGTEIWVPDASVHELRLSLAGQGLPNGGGAGFELFDQQRFGESEFSEQVKYHRALEGELTRTITHLSGVEGARVHLVLPSRSVFVSNESSATASIALKLKPGAKLSQDQIKGLVHLVASSVRGLSPEDVTIVDGSGRRLSGGEDDSEQASNSLEFQRNYERAQERSLQQILDATLGPGRALVRVAAEVSFTREELTEERVDPNAVASRSFQITEEREGNSNATSGGVPGAVGTLGGADSTLTGSTQAGLVRRSETRNFEVSKTVRRAVEPVGRVARLSVAVVVDGSWQGEGAKRTFVARSPAELATIKSVVSTAAGTKEERGDKITVECVPFADKPIEPVAAAPTLDEQVRKNWPIAAAGGGALLFLVLLFGVVRALRQKPAIEPRVNLKLGAETPQQLKLEEAANAARAELASSDSSAALPADTQAEAEQVRALAAEIASNDPYLAARVVRAWLSEGSSAETPEEAA